MSTSVDRPGAAPSGPAARGPRLLPAHKGRAAIGMAVFVALLYVIEAADAVVFDGRLDAWGGIESRELDGLDGILFAPLLHGGWAHLAANTLPLFVLGFLALAGGLGQFLAVTAVIWVVSGAAVWLIGPAAPVVTVGASGVIFGWLAFLLARGFFARSWRQIGLAVVLFVVYGGVLWGVLPGNPGISWQAHLFGALAGVLAAWIVAAADRSRTRAVRA